MNECKHEWSKPIGSSYTSEDLIFHYKCSKCGKEKALPLRDLTKQLDCYGGTKMKQIKVICPKCGITMWYKNWFDWILHTPFHWFGKRRITCSYCGIRSYVKRERY